MVRYFKFPERCALGKGGDYLPYLTLIKEKNPDGRCKDYSPSLLGRIRILLKNANPFK